MKTQSKDTYLLLFNFCKVVVGEERSIISDFQKGKIKFIPNEMASILEMLQAQPLDKVRNMFKEEISVFDSYIKFLIKEGFVFPSETNHNFVGIENYWNSPEIINNALIEYNFENYNLLNVLAQLDELLTKFIEFRFTNFNIKNIPELESVLKYCSKSVLRSLKIYIPFEEEDLAQKIIDLVTPFPVVDNIIFYSSFSKRLIETGSCKTHFITDSLTQISNSNISRKFLVNNIEFFHECQKFNPYYNRKISINSNGEIKNCIKNKALFGNVNNKSIKEVITTEEFQEFWNATHDQIVDIQKSELRYNYIITNDLEKTSDGKFKIVL